MDGSGRSRTADLNNSEKTAIMGQVWTVLEGSLSDTPSASPFKGLDYDAATLSRALSAVVVPRFVRSLATPAWRLSVRRWA